MPQQATWLLPVADRAIIDLLLLPGLVKLRGSRQLSLRGVTAA
jgi:hypothetical protein